MTAPTPQERAEGICAALARAEAAFDKRGWVEMPKADRNRYLERALIAKPFIAAAIRQAENEAIERAAVDVLDFVPDPKLTPSQSYAAMRRGDHTDRLFDRRATAVCISQKIRALKSPSPKEHGHE